MKAPYRVVDASWGPWMARRPHGPDEEALVPRRATDPRADTLTIDDVVYKNDRTREVLPYEDVARRYGPVRPVVPIPEADLERLRALCAAAGPATAATLAAALYAVEQRLDAAPPEPEGPGGIMRYDRLTAGRPGSWEAGDLIDFIWTVGPAIGPDRTDPELLDAATGMFHRWATDPDGYVEFAETLPHMLQPLVEAGGFEAVADDWLLYHGPGGRLSHWLGSLTGA